MRNEYGRFPYMITVRMLLKALVTAIALFLAMPGAPALAHGMAVHGDPAVPLRPGVRRERRQRLGSRHWRVGGSSR
jgi:hypothetical protein